MHEPAVCAEECADRWVIMLLKIFTFQQQFY